MKKGVFQYIVALIIAILSCCIYAESSRTELFSKNFEYSKAIISLDGNYIAIQRAAEKDKNMVAIVRTKYLKLMTHLPAGEKV